MSTLKYVESRLMKPGTATPMIGMMKKHAPMISKTPVALTWVPLVTYSVLYPSWITSAQNRRLRGTGIAAGVLYFMPLLQRIVAPEGSDCMNTVWVDERNMLQLVVHRTSMQRSRQRRILISLRRLGYVQWSENDRILRQEAWRAGTKKIITY